MMKELIFGLWESLFINLFVDIIPLKANTILIPLKILKMEHLLSKVMYGQNIVRT